MGERGWRTDIVLQLLAYIIQAKRIDLTTAKLCMYITFETSFNKSQIGYTISLWLNDVA